VTEYEFYWTIFHATLAQLSLLGIVYLFAKSEPLMLHLPEYTHTVESIPFEYIQLKCNLELPREHFEHDRLYMNKPEEILINKMNEFIKPYIELENKTDTYDWHLRPYIQASIKIAIPKEQ